MNSRLAVAVHVCTLLAERGGEAVTSEYIAGSVNTNASLIRRLLGALARAGITTSQLGAGGGARLARPASAVTLRDVYRAVDDAGVFAGHRERPNPACPVGRNIQAALDAEFARATQALEAELARTTIADVLRDVRRHDRRPGRRAAS